MRKDYAIAPYISEERRAKGDVMPTVPVRNMEPLTDGLLAGDIILLWRIGFDTFTTESWFPKYFEYTYGINAALHLQQLIDKGYVLVESAKDSLDHITSKQKKEILKAAGVTGFSKMKAGELDETIRVQLTEQELASQFAVRGIVLTAKGRAALENHQAVVDRHPKKKF